MSKIRLRHFRFGRPAGAADIPEELFDLIISFFTITSYEKNLDHITLDKRELGRIALVCRRWATLTQPKIFESIVLRCYEDVNGLTALIMHPACKITEYVERLGLSLSVAEARRKPWVHTVCSVLLPKFSRLEEGVTLDVAGPSPPNERMQSIHKSLPRYHPSYSSRLIELRLTEVHFKSVSNVLQLLKEMPWVQTAHLKKVTWDAPAADDDRVPAAVSYASRCRYLGDMATKYTMEGCTDNAAACWMSMLLAPTWTDRLQQDHAEALCRIASALIIDIDQEKYPDFKVHADRHGEAFSFWAEHRADEYVILTPSMSVHLDTALPGQRRQARAVTFDFDEIATSSGSCDWTTIDKQLAAIPGLTAVVFAFDTRDDVLSFHANAMVAKMPQLQHSPILKYAINTNKGRRIQVSFSAEDGALAETGEYSQVDLSWI